MQYSNNSKLGQEKGNGIIKVLSQKSNGRLRLLMSNEDNSKAIYNEVIPPTVTFTVQNNSVNWTKDSNKNDSYALKFKTDKQVCFHFLFSSKLIAIILTYNLCTGIGVPQNSLFATSISKIINAKFQINRSTISVCYV